jgi:hypothetical protein
MRSLPRGDLRGTVRGRRGQVGVLTDRRSCRDRQRVLRQICTARSCRRSRSRTGSPTAGGTLYEHAGHAHRRGGPIVQGQPFQGKRSGLLVHNRNGLAPCPVCGELIGGLVRRFEPAVPPGLPDRESRSPTAACPSCSASTDRRHRYPQGRVEPAVSPAIPPASAARVHGRPVRVALRGRLSRSVVPA